MGLIVNKPLPDLNFGMLLQTLDIPLQGQNSGLGDAQANADDPVYFGGPVETSRGFVLHTPDVIAADASLPVSGFATLSTSLDILAQIARGQGPAQRSSWHWAMPDGDRTSWTVNCAPAAG